MKTVKLNNDMEMPILGYGVYLVESNECERCVSETIRLLAVRCGNGGYSFARP